MNGWRLFVFFVLFAGSTSFAAERGPVRAASSSRTQSGAERARLDQLLESIHSIAGFERTTRSDAVFAELRTRDPENAYLRAADAELQYQMCRAGKGGSLAAAVADAERALASDAQLSWAYITLAKAHAAEGRGREAKAAADAAIALAGERPEAMLAAAQAAQALDDFAAAEKWILKALAALPLAADQSIVYRLLSRHYAERRPVAFDKAVDAALKAVELAPANPERLADVAQLLNEQSVRYEEAGRYARQSLKLRDTLEGRRQLAVALYQRWAVGYLYPERAEAAPLTPQAIRQITGIAPVVMFAEAPRYRSAPDVPLALLKSKLVRKIDMMPQGYTALMTAARFDNVAVARLLIEKGADINAEDAHRFTPLFFFARNGSAEGVELMIEQGARVNVADDLGTPLIHVALRHDDRALTNTKKLMAATADPSLPDATGANLLIVAAALQNHAALQMLLGRRLDPNARDAAGRSALAYAVSASGSGRKENVALLLKAGANPWVKLGPNDLLEYLDGKGPHAIEQAERSELARLVRDARVRTPKPGELTDLQAHAVTSAQGAN